MCWLVVPQGRCSCPWRLLDVRPQAGTLCFPKDRRPGARQARRQMARVGSPAMVATGAAVVPHGWGRAEAAETAERPAVAVARVPAALRTQQRAGAMGPGAAPPGAPTLGRAGTVRQGAPEMQAPGATPAPRHSVTRRRQRATLGASNSETPAASAAYPDATER